MKSRDKYCTCNLYAGPRDWPTARKWTRHKIMQCKFHVIICKVSQATAQAAEELYGPGDLMFQACQGFITRSLGCDVQRRFWPSDGDGDGD